MERGVIGGASVRTLGQYESLRLHFDGRDEHITISGNGDISYDLGTHGNTVNLFQAGETPTEDDNDHPELTRALTGYYPNKSDRICQYLSMLYEAQKIDHNVHTEIGEALKALKQEAGI